MSYTRISLGQDLMPCTVPMVALTWGLEIARPEKIVRGRNQKLCKEKRGQVVVEQSRKRHLS